MKRLKIKLFSNLFDEVTVNIDSNLPSKGQVLAVWKNLLDVPPQELAETGGRSVIHSFCRGTG